MNTFKKTETNMNTFKKTETKKLAKIGKYDLVKTTWTQSDDGDTKLVKKDPVIIKVKK